MIGSAPYDHTILQNRLFINRFLPARDVVTDRGPSAAIYGYSREHEQRLALRSGRRRRLILVNLLSSLSAFTYFKIAGLQASDVVLLFILGCCLWKAGAQRFVFRASAQISDLIRSYSLLLVILLGTSIFAMEQTFYPLYDVGFMFHPGLRSFAKLLQLASVVCGFLWLTNILVRDKTLLVSALSLYWWIGMAGAVYTVCWYSLSKITHIYPVDFPIAPVYSVDGSFLRARGFFNEGGPYGVYIVSVWMAGVLRQKVSGKRLGWISVFILFSFMLSASKAGFFVAALLLFYWVLSAASVKKKIIYLSAAICFVLSAAAYIQVGNLLDNYVDSYEKLGTNAQYFGRDPNVVIGRIAASYIVPRMIAARPLTGVGLGNYPLTRNDPRYLGSLPAMMDVEDVPGAGIPGIAAEIGMPLTIWVVFLLFVPYRITKRRDAIIGMTALVQPLAHAFGLQLTFFYPWFITACAIAASECSGATMLTERKPAGGINHQPKSKV